MIKQTIEKLKKEKFESLFNQGAMKDLVYSIIPLVPLTDTIIELILSQNS